MTNILAAIIITVSTNWMPVAKWTPIAGSVYSQTNCTTKTVEYGYYKTNVLAIFEWNKSKHEAVLETHDGPKCAERYVNEVNYWIATNSLVPINIHIFTNWTVDKLIGW